MRKKSPCTPSGRSWSEERLEPDHVVATRLEALKGGLAGFVRATDLLVGQVSVSAVRAAPPWVVANAGAVVAVQAISRRSEALRRGGGSRGAGEQAGRALPQLFVRK